MFVCLEFFAEGCSNSVLFFASAITTLAAAWRAGIEALFLRVCLIPFVGYFDAFLAVGAGGEIIIGTTADKGDRANGQSQGA